MGLYESKCTIDHDYYDRMDRNIKEERRIKREYEEYVKEIKNLPCSKCILEERCKLECLSCFCVARSLVSDARETWEDVIVFLAKE